MKKRLYLSVDEHLRLAKLLWQARIALLEALTLVEASQPKSSRLYERLRQLTKPGGPLDLVRSAADDFWHKDATDGQHAVHGRIYHLPPPPAREAPGGAGDKLDGDGA